MARFVSDEEARRQTEAGNIASLFTVFGFIANEPGGPVRWAGCFEAFDWKMAEQEAMDMCWEDMQDGQHAVLLPCATVQGWVGNVDRDESGAGLAYYCDDPDRPRGHRDAQRLWEAPVGFRGTEEQRPFPVLPAATGGS
jgi:hypothetical protein